MTSARFALLKRSTVPTRYPVMRRIRSNCTPSPAFPPSTRNPFHVLPDSHSPILLIPASSIPAATACPPSRSHNCSCSVPSAEEQPVHHAPGPCPHPVPRPAVTARGQGFVRPATKKRIEELVDGDQRSLSVCHAASTSSAVVAASTAALRSPPRCIVSFLCFMAPPA